MLLQPLGFDCPPGGDRDMVIPPGFSLIRDGIYTTTFVSDVFIPISKSYSSLWGEQVQFMVYPKDKWEVLLSLNLSSLYDTDEFVSFMSKHGVHINNVYQAIVWCDSFLYHNKWTKG